MFSPLQSMFDRTCYTLQYRSINEQKHSESAELHQGNHGKKTYHLTFFHSQHPTVLLTQYTPLQLRRMIHLYCTQLFNYFSSLLRRKSPDHSLSCQGVVPYSVTSWTEQCKKKKKLHGSEVISVKAHHKVTFTMHGSDMYTEITSLYSIFYALAFLTVKHYINQTILKVQCQIFAEQ